MVWTNYQAAVIIMATSVLICLVFCVYILVKTFKELKTRDKYMVTIVVLQTLSCLIVFIFLVLNLISTFLPDTFAFFNSNFLYSIQLWGVSLLALTYGADMTKWWQFILIVCTNYTPKVPVKKRLNILNLIFIIVSLIIIAFVLILSIIEDAVDEQSQTLRDIQSYFLIVLYFILFSIIVATMVVLISQLKQK